MRPLWRTTVISSVGLAVSGGLVVLALVGRNVQLFVFLTLAAALIAAVVGGFAFVMAWRESQRQAAAGEILRSVAVAAAGGGMIIVTGVALAGAAWIILLFFL